MTDAGADIEILIGKIHKIKVNLKKSSAQKVSKIYTGRKITYR